MPRLGKPTSPAPCPLPYYVEPTHGPEEFAPVPEQSATQSAAVPAQPRYRDVDVAIVMESTYPYLNGGVSTVVHDIVTFNAELTFGIIHITWDSASPHEDLYGMPANVAWVKPMYLSMAEHVEDFVKVDARALGRASQRARRSHTIFDALAAIQTGDMAPMWKLYDEGINPRTRSYELWGLLGTKEFMLAARARLNALDLSLVDTFWLLREFFSLLCAVMSGDNPVAKVYHAHTTGYAALLGAAAARQNGAQFMLTEHNLYVRDTINTLLDRNMALAISAGDWRDTGGEFGELTPVQRAWMAWWIEMARFTYPSARLITYLYPMAIIEAGDLGAPMENAIIVPNGVNLRDFDDAYARRLAARAAIAAKAEDGTEHRWRLAFIARVVPIKGLADLINVVDILVKRGVTNFSVDVLGPTDHVPDYYMLCREKMRTAGVEDYFVFRGVVNVRMELANYDLLALPSYNEGQPIVVLEVMAAGIPTVGTEVGGMAQLIHDPLTTPGGRTWGPCGLLVPTLGMPDISVMADGLQTLMRDPEMYDEYARNARGRVDAFFQLQDAMGAYNRLYKEVGDLTVNELETNIIDLRDVPHLASQAPGEPGEVVDLREPSRALSALSLFSRRRGRHRRER